MSFSIFMCLKPDGTTHSTMFPTRYPSMAVPIGARTEIAPASISASVGNTNRYVIFSAVSTSHNSISEFIVTTSFETSSGSTSLPRFSSAAKSSRSLRFFPLNSTATTMSSSKRVLSNSVINRSLFYAALLFLFLRKLLLWFLFCIAIL